MTKTTAIGDVRVLRVGGRGGDSFLSPELQRQSIQRVCQRDGLALVDVLEDLDVSGGRRHPAAMEPGNRTSRPRANVQAGTTRP